MTFRIPAGKHRSRPFRLNFCWRKTSFTWSVKFDESCRYDLQSEDQFDTNKLVGIGYLWHHHKESARFGWRYWTSNGMIELSAYCYVNGRRVIQHIAFCEIGKEYRLELTKLATMYYFSCYDHRTGYLQSLGEAEVAYDHERKLGYRLGSYFGGQSVAPHEIKIEISTI